MFRIKEKDKKVGLYSTIVFHLVLIIILLATTIQKVVSGETSFVLDFTGQDELERELRELEIKERAQQEVEDLLSGRTPVQNYRNVAVARSGRELRDDRFKDPSQVYDEAEELQRKLDESRRLAALEQGSDDASVSRNEVKKSEEAYKGPSVISYSLDNRRAISLPVPVYKCYSGGDVSVRITVNRKGYVIAAEVATSSSDECLAQAAVQAAKRSRFSASANAPERQTGEIVYRFIAQ